MIYGCIRQVREGLRSGGFSGASLKCAVIVAGGFQPSVSDPARYDVKGRAGAVAWAARLGSTKAGGLEAPRYDRPLPSPRTSETQHFSRRWSAPRRVLENGG